MQGKAGLSKAVVKFGNVEIYTVEIDDEDGRNILNKAIKKHILGWMQCGNCIGVWFGMPCNTFSPARAHSMSSGESDGMSGTKASRPAPLGPVLFSGVISRSG